MGAGYSSSVDSTLVFPAPRSSYSANTHSLLWLHSSSVTRHAVPAFLIKPNAAGCQAKFPVRTTRQSQRQPHQIQLQQGQCQQKKEHGDKQQQEARKDTGLGGASPQEALLREPQSRKMQQRAVQPQRVLRGSEPLYQRGHQQHHSVRRKSVLKHQTLGHHLPGFQQQFSQAHGQYIVRAPQRESPGQGDSRAARICSSALSSTGRRETADVCSNGSRFVEFLSASATDGDVRRSSLEDSVSERCRCFSSGSKQEQHQQHPRKEVQRRKQQDKQSNQTQSRSALRRSLSWSCCSGRTQKPEQEFCMLYFHGNACDANMMRAWLQTLANEVGVTILIFEYPGYGVLKKFHTSSHGIDLCARIAFEYIVQDLGYPVENVILCGRSIGTGAAAWLACELGQSGLYVGGLVLIAPFVSLASVAADWIKAPAVLTEYLVHNHWNTENALRRIPNVPLCIIHGQLDNVIPVEHSKRLVAAASAPRWLRVVHLPSTADHDVGVSFSSLLLDVVAPLQLFLGKIAAASSRRELKSHVLRQTLDRRRCYIMRHHFADNLHLAEFPQRRRRASCSTRPKRRSEHRHTPSGAASDVLVGSDAQDRPPYHRVLARHSAQQQQQERQVQQDQQQRQQQSRLGYVLSTQTPCAVHAASPQVSPEIFTADVTASTTHRQMSQQNAEPAEWETIVNEKWIEKGKAT